MHLYTEIYKAVIFLIEVLPIWTQIWKTFRKIIHFSNENALNITQQFKHKKT